MHVGTAYGWPCDFVQRFAVTPLRAQCNARRASESNLLHLRLLVRAERRP